MQLGLGLGAKALGHYAMGIASGVASGLSFPKLIVKN
jgi:hypothetical protein